MIISKNSWHYRLNNYVNRGDRPDFTLTSYTFETMKSMIKLPIYIALGKV